MSSAEPTPPRASLTVRADRVVGRAGDAALDASVVGFAWWTLLYDVGLPGQASTAPLLLAWALLCAATLGGLVVLRRRGTDGRRRADPASPVTHRLAPLWVAAAVAAAVVTVNVREHSWVLAWLGPAAVVAAALLAFLRRSAPPATAPVADDVVARARGHVAAAFVALGLAAFSLFVLRPNADDVYYVNRAVWVRAHGRIPLRDTIFGDQVHAALSGEKAPVASIETLQGALARLVGIPAGSVVYHVTTFVATALATWALWRLVRRWAGDRALLGFLVAVVYLLFSAVVPTTFGNFHLVRIWQGKSILVSMVVPAAFAYLTEWWESRRRVSLLLLLAAGAAGVGMSTSGVFVLPLVAAAGAMPALLRRDARGLVGPVLLAAYPIAAGLAVHFSLHGGVATAAPTPLPGDMFRRVLGTGLVAVAGWAAVVAAPHLGRSRAAAQVALGAAVLAVLVLAPGAVNVLEAMTGAPQVLWRVLWVAPAAAAVATVTAGWANRWLRLGACVAVAVAVAVGGAPLWARDNNVTLTASPVWKIRPVSLANAHAIARHAPAGAVVLAPIATMEALAETTVRTFTAGPRDPYVNALDDESPAAHRRRLELTHWASPGYPHPTTPTAGELRALLREFDVGYTCVRRGARTQLLRAAGFANGVPVRGLECFRTNG